MNKTLVFLLAIVFPLGASTMDSAPSSAAMGQSSPPYTLLGEDLERLRASFNDMSHKLRLVFIGGPACPVCLRGMEDLNESIVASLQDDPRVHTFMVHVPALDSTAQHAEDAIPLMPGPRVTHYWDPKGNTGLRFQEALDISIYAWDVWMVYEPGVLWEDDIPPPPAFWQHQLPPLDKAQRLDAEQFAAEVRARIGNMAAVGPGERPGR